MQSQENGEQVSPCTNKPVDLSPRHTHAHTQHSKQCARQNDLFLLLEQIFSILEIHVAAHLLYFSKGISAWQVIPTCLRFYLRFPRTHSQAPDAHAALTGLLPCSLSRHASPPQGLLEQLFHRSQCLHVDPVECCFFQSACGWHPNQVFLCGLPFPRNIAGTSGLDKTKPL